MDRASQIQLRAPARPLVAAALLVLLCAASVLAASTRATAQTPQRPNFVVIQTDDQTLDSLYAAYRLAPGAPKTRVMPNALDMLGKRGMTFTRYYVSYPLCCPSRVSLLTGRYAHNHGVRGNNPPNHGYLGFAARAASRHNVATWLQGAGYRTVHVGKVMNGYGEPPWEDGSAVPPGWSSWYGLVNQDRTHYYYGYTMNINGQVVGPFGDSGSWDTREYGVRDDPGCPFAPANPVTPCHHLTDTLNRITVDEIAATPPGQPFYVQLDHSAPHGDFRRPAGPEPAPRHYDWFRGVRLPHDRSEGLNEHNVRDKPRFLRDAPKLTNREIRTYRVYWQKQLDAMRSVDDGIRDIIGTLRRTGRLDNTYIVFTSDNGFFFGEHRLLGGKFLAYEPATRLPFLIRGPGIKPGSSSGELAANVDIAPTVLEMAGVKADKSIDGRSLVPFIEDPERRTRRPVMFQSFVQSADVEADLSSPAGASAARARGGGADNDANASILAPPKDYGGIRLGPFKYIAWPSGEKELYDLNTDPHELESLHRVPNLYPIRNFLHRQLRQYENCVGHECRKATPKLPLTRKQAQELRAEKRREIRERERQRERERRERERRRNR